MRIYLLVESISWHPWNSGIGCRLIMDLAKIYMQNLQGGLKQFTLFYCGILRALVLVSVCDVV